jgi:hypothetical protein
VRRASSARNAGFVHRARLEGEVGGRVLEQDAAAEHLLDLLDMLGDPGKRRLGVGQRQQVVEEDPLVGRPGQMLGDKAGLVALTKAFEPCEMRLVERGVTADREPHTVQRERVVRADGREVTVRRAALAHVVLGVHLEPATAGLVVSIS